MMRQTIFLFTLGLLFSCAQPEESKPSSLLTEVEMIDALVEVHLLESAAQLNMLEGVGSGDLTLEDYYKAVFAEKAYTLEAFDSSFTYYANQPELMERFMDSALVKIQMIQ